jgi:hypothetical protein
MALRIVADQAEVRVTAGTATSVRLDVMGSPRPGDPVVVSLVPDPAGVADQWTSVEVSAAGGASSGTWVTFDPSRGSRPRPDAYPVEVQVTTGDQRASTVVRFVVDRHPCLQVHPQPSFTWNPVTNTATLSVALWSCGNVDLNVSWSAQLKGRHLDIQPGTLMVSADGTQVDTTLTITLPDRTVDLDADIDVQAVSEAGINVVSASVLAKRGRSSHEHHRGRLLAVAIAGLVLFGTVVAIAVSLNSDDDRSSGSGPVTTGATVPTTATTTNVTTTSVVETTTSARTTTVDPPHLVLKDSAKQEITPLGTPSGLATFRVMNTGGSDGDVTVTEFRHSPTGRSSAFLVAEQGCTDGLEPDEECIVQVSFLGPPPPAGKYSVVVHVEEHRTGGFLELTVNGTVSPPPTTTTRFAEP